MANQLVAYQDDRHGLAAWVAEEIAKSSAPARDGDPADRLAAPVSTGAYGLSLSGGGAPARYPARRDEAHPDFSSAYKAWTSARASAESTVAAVVGGQARWGVLPLMDDGGFERDTLAALIDFPQARPVREFVASSNYVLAVPTDMIHEAEQAGFTDSFSPGGSQSFQWTEAKRSKYRARVGTVLASTDALRHCAAAVEGLRAAHAMLDPERQVETRYSGERQERRSRTRGANAHKPLVGILMTLDKAMGDQGYVYGGDYTVLDAQMAGADPVRTSYVAVGKPAKARTRDPVRAAYAEIDAAFAANPRRLPNGDARDDRASRAAFGYGGDAPTVQDSAPCGGSALVRVLWAVATTGTSDGARGRMVDYAPILSELTRARIAHKVTPLDGRPGNPVVIAFDLEAGASRRAKPIIRKLAAMRGSQRLATFPATEPLVPEAMRAKGEEGRGAVWAATAMVGVLGVLGLVLAWRWVAG